MADAATWQDTATAIGTIGATLAAVGLGATAELRTNRDRSERRTTNEQQQAQRVAAWMEFRKGTTFVVIQNASEEPIWDVKFSVEDGEPSADIESLRVVAPGRAEHGLMQKPALDDAPIRLSFRDNAGREWVRDEQGILKRWGIRGPKH